MTFAGADASDSAYNWAWGAIAFVFLYYLVATICLNWSRNRSTGVTEYEPPKGLSPAIAAYLVGNGNSERAFAAALVSLAVKGYLEIRQKRDWFTLKRLREADNALAPEESVALFELFPFSNDVCKFDGRENSRLYRAFQKFQSVAEGIAETDLISSHSLVWGAGAGVLAMTIVLLALPLPFYESGDLNVKTYGAILFFGFWVVMGVYCLVAALRLWPVTLRRLASFLPNSTVPRRPLGWNDMFPVWLSAAAALGFALLGAVTSPRFAALVIACEVLVVTFRHILYGPTTEGQKLIAHLRGFREFLSRADSDRLNRQNEVAATPRLLDRDSAYAIALDVEHAWGEEFAEDVLEMVQFDRAIDFPRERPVHDFFTDDSAENDDTPIQLNLNSRK